MKHHYYLLILITFFQFTSCKENQGRQPEGNRSITLGTPEEDQKRLDKKLALTEKRWDSLQTILQREALPDKYRDSIKKLFLKNRHEQEEIYKNFIRENPGSEIAVSNLNGFKFTWGKELTEELFESLSPQMQESENGQKIRKYVEFYNSPQVGDAYTEFELPNLKGERVQITDSLGKYTLLEFWAAWCSGCRKKHPELIQVYEKFKDGGFKVIGISGDNSEDDWQAAVAQDELPWLNLRGSEGRESVVQYQYGIHYLPANFLIGPDGKIVAKDVYPEELDEILQELL